VAEERDEKVDDDEGLHGNHEREGVARGAGRRAEVNVTTGESKCQEPKGQGDLQQR